MQVSDRISVPHIGKIAQIDTLTCNAILDLQLRHRYGVFVVGLHGHARMWMRVGVIGVRARHFSISPRDTVSSCSTHYLKLSILFFQVPILFFQPSILFFQLMCAFLIVAFGTFTISKSYHVLINPMASHHLRGQQMHESFPWTTVSTAHSVLRTWVNCSRRQVLSWGANILQVRVSCVWRRRIYMRETSFCSMLRRQSEHNKNTKRKENPS